MLYLLIYALITASGAFLIGLILRLLVQKKLNETNAILWIVIGIVIMLSGLFPKSVVVLSNWFFITYPPAFVFTLAIIILLFIVLRLSIQIADFSARLQDMASEVSIMKYEMHKMSAGLKTETTDKRKEEQGGFPD